MLNTEQNGDISDDELLTGDCNLPVECVVKLAVILTGVMSPAP